MTPTRNFTFVTLGVTALIILILGEFGYLKYKEFTLQMHSITIELDNTKGAYNRLSYDLKESQMGYHACVNDEAYTVNSGSGQQISFTFRDTGIYSPLLATQSGSMEVWNFKDILQTEYQANLPPYDFFHIKLILHKSESPYLISNCGNSPIDSFHSVCHVSKLDLSKFTFQGLTKRGFPYYQGDYFGFTTFIRLPANDKQENRTVIMWYNGKKTDTGYQQYLSLVQEIDTKVY